LLKPGLESSVIPPNVLETLFTYSKVPSLNLKFHCHLIIIFIIKDIVEPAVRYRIST